jgi:hypothetical protein
MNRIASIAGRLTITLGAILAFAPIVPKVFHTLWG